MIFLRYISSHRFLLEFNSNKNKYKLWSLVVGMKVEWKLSVFPWKNGNGMKI
jgi:hypothetical protein